MKILSPAFPPCRNSGLSGKSALARGSCIRVLAKVLLQKVFLNLGIPQIRNLTILEMPFNYIKNFFYT